MYVVYSGLPQINKQKPPTRKPSAKQAQLAVACSSKRLPVTCYYIIHTYNVSPQFFRFLPKKFEPDQTIE